MTSQTALARTLVATLRVRQRFSAKRLHYVQQNQSLFPGLSCTLEAEFAEAKNAAETARGILRVGCLAT